MSSNPAPQEVYILDCRSCGTFLTNRGMSAVLLLQPDVSLYSTDALPVNCSVSPGSPQLPPYQEDHISLSSNTCPSGLPGAIPRTCECLTQTLCCHGCGSAVGYMVVIPCRRCCNSITPTDRHISRHRFVFFNKEIKANIRHYIPNEPGVIPHSPRLTSVINPSTNSAPSQDSNSPSRIQFNGRSYTDRSSIVSERSAQGSASVSPTSASDLTAPRTADAPHILFVCSKPQRGVLREGDILYWHNLSKNGEIPAVTDDIRARYTYVSSTELAGR